MYHFLKLRFPDTGGALPLGLYNRFQPWVDGYFEEHHLHYSKDENIL